MKYQKCSTCNGSGTVMNHMHSSHAGLRSAGQGVSVCPSCNGSGNNGALANDNASAVGGQGLGYLLGYTLGPPLIVAGIGGAIAYYIFGTEVSGWVGAGIGFGASMLNESWRKEFLSMMSKIIIGVVILVIIIFLFDTFSEDAKDKESKNDPATPEKISIQERLKDTQSSATAPDEYKCALCSVYAAEELSDSQRESCIKKGCSFSESPSRPSRARPE